MAQLYVHSSSVSQGEVLWLRVSSNQDRFRVDFYRQGAQLERVDSATFSGGRSAPLQAHDTDFQWPAFAFPVPFSWRSGAYLAIVGPSLNAAQAKHLAQASRAIERLALNIAKR